jgi:threonylcarbamoyladenosine tRNA methylthiotransferase MtaB
MKSPTKPGPSGPGTFSLNSFNIQTLGCKSNQYDSAALAADLEKAGFVRSEPEEARVIIVNTCMVTGPTEAQCRKAIRQARRANPDAKLVVAGCMSRGSRKQLETMDEVDLVLDPAEKGSLVGLLDPGSGEDAEAVWVDWPEEAAVEMEDRDRGFLKVQDGCNASCSYCIVPSVRGRSRSLEPERVLGAVGKLMEQGLGEVVLSGIHLGQYGKDLPGNWCLERLLVSYLELDLPGRLRLSSLEPLEITDHLVALVADSGNRICRHFHIPLQSGSDQVLKAMNRPYRGEQFAQAVSRIKAAIPGAGIGCDVICGFPGETETDFRDTLDLVAGLKLPFIHAFPYSPRPGTPAASLKDDIPHEGKKERVASLTKTVKKNRVAFAKGFVGQAMIMALESRTDSKGRIVALADTYLRGVVKDGSRVSHGKLLETVITGVEDDLLLAEQK